MVRLRVPGMSIRLILKGRTHHIGLSALVTVATTPNRRIDNGNLSHRRVSAIAVAYALDPRNLIIDNPDRGLRDGTIDPTSAR